MLLGVRVRPLGFIHFVNTIESTGMLTQDAQQVKFKLRAESGELNSLVHITTSVM